MFDFTTLPDRHGHDALAVDAIGEDNGDPLMRPPAAPRDGYDAIPMWVADMNFATAPAVTDAIAARLAHPLFGYFEPTQAYYDAIIGWHRRRNGVTGLKPEHIGYENGVLGGVVSALRAFATPGDAVLVHSPTYNGFTMTIEGAGFRLEHSPLRRDADGVWRMDYEDMDRRLKAKRIHAAVFCSPHNPTGRVWERWEIERAMDVFRANDCVVISDEIWSDLILDRAVHPHIPTQSVGEDARRRTIALYAPSKTFNLAGLIGSYHVVYDPYLRDRLTAVESKTPYNEMNVLSMHALIGAYSREGEAWLDELLGVLAGNLRIGYRFFAGDAAAGEADAAGAAGVPGVEVARPQGTYMLFLDCERWCAEHRDELLEAARRRAAASDATGVSGVSGGVGGTLSGESDGTGAFPPLLRPDADPCMDELLRQGWDVGVAWQDGRAFAGRHTIRMNFALPEARVREALHRLATHVFTR
ncbi:MalY/PatB family protein [Bifidobacterium saguinibicoloris]|uniref:MalY/PatB family protein n=1 Tax=Bifidobacterium saguinibicoloris TaxID=2834433 RepID=UPI001F2E1B3D|nr:aminotransferase class I/II-fold pyridoxal phosphate-dependent enzyme [Bifidobacterium saguinibicoloris]